jgi:hypothetical protein
MDFASSDNAVCELRNKSFHIVLLMMIAHRSQNQKQLVLFGLLMASKHAFVKPTHVLCHAMLQKPAQTIASISRPSEDTLHLGQFGESMMI